MMKYGMKIEGFCNEFRCFKQGEALPIDIRMLADLAERCHDYAKALHYKVRVCCYHDDIVVRAALTMKPFLVLSSNAMLSTSSHDCAI